MNLIMGERANVLDSTDRTQVGLRGEVILETAGTIMMNCEGRRVRVQKRGTVIQLEETLEIIRCDDILGSLEDRIGRAKA